MIKLPRTFIGEIGVLKKRTYDMLTTRLKKSATERVTGNIMANKLYETCHKNKVETLLQVSKEKSK